MRTHSSRAVVAATAALALLSGLPAAAQQNPRDRAISSSETVNPGEIVSQGGTLNAQLTIAPGTVTFGDSAYKRNLYNDSYVPPTLRLNPGDSVNLTLVNGIRAQIDPSLYNGNWTNLHFHGFNVTPIKPGDQVITTVVDSASSFNFAFRLPTWHPEGLFWYHPHPHGISDGQVLGGMSGAIVVGDLLKYFPQYRNAPERILLIKDFQGRRNDSTVTILNINGDPSPNFSIYGGQNQFWRIANVGADTYVNLHLEGHQFLVLARDGNRVVQPVWQDSLVLPPAARAEVIVNGGLPFRTSRLFAAPIQFQQDTVWLGTLRSMGPPVASGPLAALPPRDATLADSIRALFQATPDASRRFVFRSPPEGSQAYTINGDTFAVSTINTRVPLGNVEDWTIVNDSDELHVFHIHQLDFLVTDDGTGRPDTLSFRDVVNMPPNSTIKVRIPFTEPLIEGLFVYHCHILFHEDRGMMQSICVYDPEKGPGSCDQWLAGAAHAHPTS